MMAWGLRAAMAGLYIRSYGIVTEHSLADQVLTAVLPVIAAAILLPR
jgi:hypothetical protein